VLAIVYNTFDSRTTTSGKT